MVERKLTIASNFFAGRFLKEGIGAVGLTSVRSMPWRGIRDPMWVRLGPGPELPLSPIVWHASQPDWAMTMRPSFQRATAAGPFARTAAGVEISNASGVPAVAPW